MFLLPIKIEREVASIHGESNHLNILNLVVDTINTRDHPVDAGCVLRVHVVANTLVVQVIYSGKWHDDAELRCEQWMRVRKLVGV